MTVKALSFDVAHKSLCFTADVFLACAGFVISLATKLRKSYYGKDDYEL